MLRLTAQRVENRRIVTKDVDVPGFDKLTPKAARAALEVAFGNVSEGAVWGEAYGYRVYEKSARKMYPQD